MITSESFESGREAFRNGFPKSPHVNAKWSDKNYVGEDWMKLAWMVEDYCSGWDYEQNLLSDHKC